MADAPAQEPSSTPPAEPAAEATPSAAVVEPAPPPEPAQAAEPAKEAEKTVEPVKEPQKEEPLFALPDDFKASEGMLAKFTEFVKTLPDKKFAQGAADLYVGMAREANANWQKVIEDTDKANAATCKATFTSQELTAAETAVGWFSSFDPKFRDVAKRQLNDPTFTNAMRLVGELLSEDDLGKSERPPTPSDKRPLQVRAQEALYGRKQ